MIAQSFVSEIVRLCRDRLGIRFLQARRGVVRAVAADGTCTVDAWGGQIPHVRVVQPWPGCTLSFQKGADVLLEWPRSSGEAEDAAAPGELPVIVGFYTGTSVSVDILPNGAAAAREGDSVDCGTLTLVFQGSGTYLRPDGVSVPVAPSTPFSLVGRISSGSTKVRIG